MTLPATGLGISIAHWHAGCCGLPDPVMKAFRCLETYNFPQLCIPELHSDETCLYHSHGNLGISVVSTWKHFKITLVMRVHQGWILLKYGVMVSSCYKAVKPHLLPPWNTWTSAYIFPVCSRRRRLELNLVTLTMAVLSELSTIFYGHVPMKVAKRKFFSFLGIWCFWPNIHTRVPLWLSRLAPQTHEWKKRFTDAAVQVFLIFIVHKGLDFIPIQFLYLYDSITLTSTAVYLWVMVWLIGNEELYLTVFISGFPSSHNLKCLVLAWGGCYL